MGQQTDRELAVEAEREKALREMQKEYKAISLLVKSEGWKLIEKYLNVRVKQVHLEMERASEKELHKLQSEIRTIKSVFGFLNSKILQNFDL